MKNDSDASSSRKKNCVYSIFRPGERRVAESVCARAMRNECLYMYIEDFVVRFYFIYIGFLLIFPSISFNTLRCTVRNVLCVFSPLRSYIFHRAALCNERIMPTACNISFIHYLSGNIIFCYFRQLSNFRIFFVPLSVVLQLTQRVVQLC